MLFDCKKERNKIRIDKYEWTELLKNKNILFDEMINQMLSYKNIFHMLTNSRIQRLENKGYYDIEIPDSLKPKLKVALEEIGLGEGIDINSTVTDGDIGEYITNIILISKSFENDFELILPKLIFKTTRRKAVNGRDNYYFDIANNILYLGESKFYADLDDGINDAIISLNKKTVNDIVFINKNDSLLRANTYNTYEELVNALDSNSIINEQTRIRKIIFIIAENYYLKEDVEKVLMKYSEFDGYIIIFPILNKNEFKERYKKRVGDFFHE